MLLELTQTFDHSGYYETCARIRTFEEHKANKNYCLEHTKPLFNKQKILSLFNLHIYHTFVNTFKVLKTRTPLSLYNLFIQGCRDANFLLLLPTVNLDISKNNFIFNACKIWNTLIGEILEKSLPLDEGKFKGTVVQGSSRNSDFCATVSFIKSRLKSHLREDQSSGDYVEWPS